MQYSAATALKYENVRAKNEAFCQVQTALFISRGKRGKQLKACRVRCKSWLCRTCAPHELKILRGRLFQFNAQVVANQRRLRFFTLTTRDRGQDRCQALRDINKSWDILLKRVKREYGKVRYFKIIQFHENGLPHIHGTIDKYIHKDWLSDNWFEIHGAYKTDIRYRDPHEIIGYTIRYVTRDVERDHPNNFLFHETNTRRFSFSRGAPGRFVRDPQTEFIGTVNKVFDSVLECKAFLVRTGLVDAKDPCREVGRGFFEFELSRAPP